VTHGSRRLGRFAVPTRMLEGESSRDRLAQQIFAQVIPLEMYHFAPRRETYIIGRSKLFRELQDGEEVPCYNMRFTVGDDGCSTLEPYETKEVPLTLCLGMTCPVSSLPELPPETRLVRRGQVQVGWDPEGGI